MPYFVVKMDVRHTIIRINQSIEWDAALTGFIHTPAHEHAYCKAMSLSSGMETFLYVGEGDGGAKLVCAFGIRTRGRYAELVSPYGFGGYMLGNERTNGKELLIACDEYLRLNEFVTAYVLQHPLFPLPDNVSAEDVFAGARVYMMDLSLSEEELWGRLSKGFRYDIRKTGGEAAFDLCTDQDALCKAIVELYPLTVARVGASPVYHFTEQSLDMICRMRGAFLLGAMRNSKIEAMVVFLASGTAADYFINAASESGRVYSKVLVWEMLKRLRNNGVRCVNLGGGVRPNDSLDEFKRRFQGSAVISQSVKKVFDADAYKSLCAECGVCGIDRGNYFPPYWKPS